MNLPSRYDPVSVPVSPSTRRMAADASAPDCRTMSCHAASPFELFPTWMFHRPAIAGIGASPTGAGANRLAWNGYGAPRVPREYWPSSRPSFTVASIFVPYSSKLRTSAPFSSCPVVEVVFSSPLKKDPLTPAPDPDSSIRNGTSTPLTMMVASQRPLRACARAGAGTVTSARSATTNRIDDLVLMQKLPETQKAREACASRACMRLDLVRPRLFLRGHHPCDRSAAQAGEGSGRTTRAAATADHVHACTFIAEKRREVKFRRRRGSMRRARPTLARRRGAHRLQRGAARAAAAGGRPPPVPVRHRGDEHYGDGDRPRRPSHHRPH